MQSAATILGGEFSGAASDANLAQFATGNPRFLKFLDELRARLQSGHDEWREQLSLPGRRARAALGLHAAARRA